MLDVSNPLTAAAMPEMPMDADSEPLQLVTTPHMEVYSESQGTSDNDPDRPPPPVQPQTQL